MNWLTNVVRPKIRSLLKREVPENMWIKCPDTGQLVFYKDVEANQFVIPSSNYHMRMSATARLKSMFDGETWFDIGVPEVPVDPLKFRDERRYTDRLKDARTKTGLNDAIKLGFGKLEGLGVVIGVQDFDFMGGSLGMAAGEAVVKGLETAAQKGTPFIMFAASGGARMQEGILSLMQLPRTTVAVEMLREARKPYIVVLTNPTTGGVDGLLRDARRRAHRGARRADRLRGPARDRADHPRETARGLPARRVSQGPRHGRHGGASPRAAGDAGAALPGVVPRADDRDGRACAASNAGRAPGSGSRPGGMTPVQMTSVDSVLGGIDLSLERMRRVLERLGNPQAPRAAGHSRRRHQRQGLDHRVPARDARGGGQERARLHLAESRARERAFPSRRSRRRRARLRCGARRCARRMRERANGDAPITLFEIETAAAFVLFARHPADMLLLEVGLGGRLDATNVIERPLASIVTPVSMDHIEFLGDTLEKIAAEKAGIFRNGVPAVIAPQTSAASAVLERHAEKARAPLHVAGQHWHANVENGRLVYQDEQGLFDLPPPKLFGRHQFDNAGTAIAALRAAGVRLPVKAVEQGLMRAEWPARLQRLTTGQLVALAPAGAELWLDGGHNADGGRAIAAALGDLEERVSRPLVLVVGMLATKDRDGVPAQFHRAGAPRLRRADPSGQGRAGGGDRRRRASRRHAGGRRESIEEALAAIARLGFDPPPRILITGSLYLAGEVLAANGMAPTGVIPKACPDLIRDGAGFGRITPRRKSP